MTEIIEESYMKELSRIMAERGQAVEAYIRVYLEVSRHGIDDLELVERSETKWHAVDKTTIDVTWFVRPKYNRTQAVNSAIETIVRDLRR
jgi:hypothetical protein